MANTNNPNYLVIIKQVPDPQNPGVGGLTVTAPLPETAAFDSSNEYTTPYAQGFMGDGNLSQVASSLGLRMTTQAMTAQLWQGSTDSDLMLDLDFHTETDPDADVRQPVLTLMKLAAASRDSLTGVLKAPGPKISLSDITKIAGQAASQLGNTVQQGASALGSVVGLVKPGKLNSPTTNLDSNNQPVDPAKDNGLGGAEYWKSVIRDQISIQIGRYAFYDSVVIFNVQETKSHLMDARTGLPLHSRVSVRFKPLFLITQQDLDRIFAYRG